MSEPLCATAVSFSMVPYCPANHPGKTTPANSPSTVSEASPQIQSLGQRSIIELPPELLVMIFDYLEFDDIRRVNATCLAFREVVKENNYIQELSYFARLPRSFRDQYQQTARQQKKSLHLHPFAKPAPRNGRRISFRNRVTKNLPQMSALLCLATLGKMEPCLSYHPVARYKVTLPSFEPGYLNPQTTTHGVCFSRSGGHLLFYGSCLRDSRMLARDDQGQWAQEDLNWSDNNGSRVITGAHFSAGTNHLLTCSSEGCVNTLQPAHHCWNHASKVALTDQTVQFSPSGKYMVTYGRHDPLIVWRMDKNNDWQKMEVCGLSSGAIIGKVLFSPSEQHLALALHGWNELTMLSVHDREAWSAQQVILLKNRTMEYFSFSPVSDQLLVGISFSISLHSMSPGQVSIFSPEPSGKWLETIIFPICYLLEFSSAGNYLFSKYIFGGRDLQLWPRPEKWSDWSLDQPHGRHLNAAGRERLDSAIVLEHEHRVEKTQFSPSDRHILISCTIGTIYIWGKNQAGAWSIQTITDQCVPATTPCFSLSGLHVLTYTHSVAGILGRSQQNDWPLKGVIRQDGILKAYFNPLSEHEVVVLSRTENDNITNITLTIWELNDVN
ncbi:F-box/WD40 repeat-containing protein [Endozoicomonas sp. ONNA2]|uniref:F-box/WD repeat-containing protein n=1 Tax=Endozoicomonas sp. ONNA2 TaxID=2828741 RepID=UPI0021489BEB